MDNVEFFIYMTEYFDSRMVAFVGIMAKIYETDCVLTEDRVLTYSFPDGKEFIFSLKDVDAVSSFDFIRCRGDGLLLNLAEDMDLVKDVKREHHRFYIFDPFQLIFKKRFVCFNVLDENMTQLIRERYEWLVDQFYE